GDARRRERGARGGVAVACRIAQKQILRCAQDDRRAQDDNQRQSPTRRPVLSMVMVPSLLFSTIFCVKVSLPYSIEPAPVMGGRPLHDRAQVALLPSWR